MIDSTSTHFRHFWLKEKSKEDTENLPAPEVLAAEIEENLELHLNNSIVFWKV
jgi:type I restriction enzyme M protein